MDKNELYKATQNASDIYTFIVSIFICLDKVKLSRIQSTYNKALSDNAYSKHLIKVENIIHDLPIYNYYEFNVWLAIWLQELNSSSLETIVYAFHSLLRLDGIFYEFYKSNKCIYDKGPFGQIDGYSLFLKKGSFYFDTDLSKNDIRRGRQTVEFNPNSLNKKFSSFEIIRDVDLHGYKPKVKQYNISNEFGDNITFALAPLNNKGWCIPKQNHTTKQFTVEYIKEKIENHNNNILNVIDKSNNESADIIVLPELSLNVLTEKIVTDYLLKNYIPNLKLCFLGSKWDNNVNESLLMSSNGTVLLKQSKKSAFSFYDKKEKETYTEDIDTQNKDVYFIDINGLGRLAYLICADFNDEDLISVCSVLHADFIFVSAYTNDTKLMNDTAEELAKRRATITVLSNACAAIPEDKLAKTYCNFVEVPLISPGELFAQKLSCSFPCKTNGNCEKCLTSSDLKKVL